MKLADVLKPKAPEPKVDFTPLMKTKQKRGGLPIELVLQIQQLYAQAEPQVPDNQKAQPQNLELGTGWGGQGR